MYDETSPQDVIAGESGGRVCACVCACAWCSHRYDGGDALPVDLPVRCGPPTMKGARSNYPTDDFYTHTHHYEPFIRPPSAGLWQPCGNTHEKDGWSHTRFLVFFAVLDKYERAKKLT